MVLSRLLRLSLALLASSVAVVASVAGNVAGIYPDDHWSYSTKLTTSNYADAIQAEIDNGKTVFVRFIASEVRCERSFQMLSRDLDCCRCKLEGFAHSLELLFFILSFSFFSCYKSRDEDDDENRLRPGMR